MALVYGASSTPVVTAANPSSIAVNYPTGITRGSLLMMTIGTHPETVTISSPGADWFTPANNSASGGAGTFGALTGPCKTTKFFKIADGTESGTLTVNLTTGASNIVWGVMVRIESPTRFYDIECANGVDSSAGAAWSVTAAPFMHIRAGDFLLAHCTIPTSASDPGTVSAETLTATGTTTSFSFSDTIAVEQLTNNDICGRGVGVSVTNGLATAAPVHACTWPVTATNVAGAEVFTRIREAYAAPSILGIGPSFKPKFRKNRFKTLYDFTVVETVTSTNANAGCAEVTVVSNPAPGQTATGSGSAGVAATANNASISIKPNADVASVVVVANSPGGKTSTGSGVASVVVLANGAAASIGASAGNAPVTATVNQPGITVGTNANAGVAAVTVTANGINAGTIAPTAGNAAVTVVANNPGGSTKPIAGNAAVTAVVNSPTGLVSTTSSTASVVAVANSSTGRVSTTPTTAPVGAVANQPTVITGSQTFANAGVAAVTATANGTTNKVNPGSGFAAVSAIVNTPSGLVKPAAGNAGVTVITAGDAAIGASPPTAGVVVSAFGTTSRIASGASVAAVIAQALQPVAQTVLPIPDHHFVAVRDDVLLRVIRQDWDLIITRDDIGIIIVKPQ